MTDSQNLMMVEPGKTDVSVIIDAIMLLIREHATSKTEPSSRPAAGENNITAKILENPKPENLRNQYRHDGHMDNRDRILAEYKQANLNRRLQMYLQFPFLQSDFDLMNRDDRQSGKLSNFELRTQSFAAQMGMALGSAMACRGLAT